MYRAGETPPGHELHIYHPVPGYHANHRTTGDFTLPSILRCAHGYTVYSLMLVYQYDLCSLTSLCFCPERVLLPPGLPAEVQESHGAGRDRDQGELEPSAAGERAAGPRGVAVYWGEQKERGDV